MLLEITAPELHRASCSRTYDQTPSVMCEGFQSLAWVRGGLWLHVTLSTAAGHMSNSDVNTMAYLMSSGAFFVYFCETPCTPLESIVSVFPRSRKWHWWVPLRGDGMSHVSCAVPKISTESSILREKKINLLFSGMKSVRSWYFNPSSSNYF